jgi:peptide deformylase
MIKTITRYPTSPGVEYATDVRNFDENLLLLLENMHDTIKHNNIDGLAAYQIGSYYNVVVVKNPNGEMLELINPRVLNPSEKITTEETTAYFADISAKVDRYNNISVIYQDKDKNNKSLKASGDFAILLQRKIDYTFGATFINKLSKNERKIFEKKLEYSSNVAILDSCSTTSKKDYILKFANLLTATLVILLISSIFISSSNTLATIWDTQLYISYVAIITGIAYFIYGYFEGFGFMTCSSCQVGNLLGTLAIFYLKLTIIISISYFAV